MCTLIDDDDDFFVTARLKHNRRYLSSDLTNLTTQLASEEVMYKARVSPLIRDMFERFYQNREHWSSAVKCMAEIDALCALAEASNEPNMIIPKVLPATDKPFLNIKGMRHPLIEKKFAEKEFVPNDLLMDADNKRTLLITGPNMGGKSTLLRTSCLIVIMA
jgi:DNA mismatch repair protein MSH6